MKAGGGVWLFLVLMILGRAQGQGFPVATRPIHCSTHGVSWLHALADCWFLRHFVIQAEFQTCTSICVKIRSPINVCTLLIQPFSVDQPSSCFVTRNSTSSKYFALHTSCLPLVALDAPEVWLFLKSVQARACHASGQNKDLDHH